MYIKNKIVALFRLLRASAIQQVPYWVDRGPHNVSGSTIFKLFNIIFYTAVLKLFKSTKAGGCRAAQLLGGFRGNLLIVRWVTPTPRCT